eukprot:341500-Rhodomonas_salina.1
MRSVSSSYLRKRYSVPPYSNTWRDSKSSTQQYTFLSSSSLTETRFCSSSRGFRNEDRSFILERNPTDLNQVYNCVNTL